MTVTATRLISIDHTIGEMAERNYTLVYEVDTDDVADSAITARLASGVPSRLSTFSHGNDSDDNAVLLTKKVKLVKARDSYNRWVVTCGFKTPTPGLYSSIDPTIVDDPLLQPTKWRGSFVQFLRSVTHDKDGTQIKNTAGDAFIDPPITMDDSKLSIIASKNYAEADMPDWATFVNSVNDDAWWGFGSRKIKVQSIEWDQFFFGSVAFYRVDFHFLVDFENWDIKPLHAGFYELEGGTGDRARILDKYGAPVAVPWPLNSDGSKLTQAEIDTDSEVYGAFRCYREKDYATLGLPATLGAPST